MSPQEIVNALLAGETVTEIASPAAVQALLKTAADRSVRQNVDAAQRVVAAVERFAALLQTDSAQAFAQMVAGNVQMLAIGDYDAAIAAYDRAADLAEDELEAATARVGKIAALLHQGAYDAAAQLGAEIGAVLEARGADEQLAGVLNNLALGLYVRQGDDATALAHLNRAAELLGVDHRHYGIIEMNHCVPLRHLGRYAESLQFSRSAYDRLHAQGATAEAIRARQNAAMTNFTLGNYNEALRLFEEVRGFWLADGRERDALVAELFVSDGLFQLHRYGEVIERCERIVGALENRKLHGELAQTWLLLARSYAALGRTDDALAAIAQAANRFDATANQYGGEIAQLEQAAVQLQRGEHAAATALAQAVRDGFNGRIVPQLRAALVIAAANLADAETPQRLNEIIARAESAELNTVLYRAHELLGDWHAQQGDAAAALASYERALAIIELLKGRLMVEFRITFADGTFDIYEKATAQCIAQGQFAEALQLAERAKSRALLDMIAHRLDLSIEARQAADQPLVDELLQLREQRDHLYRQLGSRDDLRLSAIVADNPALAMLRQQIGQFEQRITTLWHQLLIRNADYTRDAALWQVQAQIPQMDSDTVLVEYFALGKRFVVFLVSAETIEVVELSTTSATIERWLQFFKINCQRAVPNLTSPKLFAALTAQAKQFLQRLHAQLIAPIADAIAPFANLVIVPHGALHHVPFHALHDGTRYLIDQHAISYLPSASLANSSTRTHNPDCFVAFGYSSDQQLQHTVREAEQLATLMQGEAYVEEAATLARFRQEAGKASVLHLATHGEFNANNTLFSGLTLHDGQLVTLDVFSLNLQAGLVTLSACQTGQNVVSQGNELLGLMRGFLTAGAESLLLTHWSVEDESTARLMTNFYQNLQAGLPKAVALQKIQKAWANGATAAYTHPYFWAPFFLVGDAGRLTTGV